MFKKIMSSIKKRSFYLVLMMCVIAIAITAVYVTRARLDYLSENTLVEEDSEYKVGNLNKDDTLGLEDIQYEDEKEEENDVVNEETTIELKAQDEPEKTQLDEKQIVAQTVENENNIKQESAQEVAQKPQKKFSIEKIIMPVEGKVIKEFSIDELLYSKTLEQWCTHNGLDISSPAGNPVKAVGDGVIEDIYTDDMLGITIVIDHGEEYKTKYCNLSSTDMVKKGEFVKEGQVISGIGKTAISEKNEESHLHFEIIYNNKNIDPYNYLPISSMH